MKTLVPCFLISSTLVLVLLGCLALAASTPPVPRRSSEPRTETKPAPAPVDESAPTVIELAEVRIVGTRPRRIVREKLAELVPCSGWEELGPVFSARAGEVPATRHVQRLCPRSESR